MAKEAFNPYGLAELYQPRRQSHCFDGSRLSPGTVSPVSSNPGVVKYSAAQRSDPVKQESACSAGSVAGSHVPDVIPVLGNLLDADFRTDDFRINHFKVTECSNVEPHDWTLCAFAHVGEKARRRDTAVFKYVATACPDFRKGTCKRGDLCPFAHGVFESWLHSGRYRTQLCKDGHDCDRPVCFFAHSIDELRTPTLPISLANSQDGAAFAAFFGGPSLGSLKGPSSQMQQQAPPQPAQPHSAALQQATRQQQAVLQMLQQQQEALKQGQDALRQEQLNLQAAAMRLREQYAALAQAQHGLQAQQKQPTSPMGSSSCNSEGAPGHMLGSISGSDDELTFSSDQLQSIAVTSDAEAFHGKGGSAAAAAPVAAAAVAPQVSGAVMSAWLASRGCASSTAMRSAAQLGTLLHCLPNLPAAGQVDCALGPLSRASPSPQDARPWHPGSQPQVSLSAALPPQNSMAMVAQQQSAAAARYAHASVPAASEGAILPLSVPPVLAAIWEPTAAKQARWSEAPQQQQQQPMAGSQQSPVSVHRQLSAY